QDKMVKTIFDKSVISGTIRKDTDGNMVIHPGKDGVINPDHSDPASDDQLLFDYTGDIFSVKTDEETGELIKMREKIGFIEGTAAFPVSFAYLSAGFKAIMDLLEAGHTLGEAMGMVGITALPPVLDWTCNHCEMTIGDSTYVNIVDALDPVNGNPDMIAKYDVMIAGGSANALDSMRLNARAFLGLTPASMDPIAKTMSIRMAGCSAIVGVSGPNAGMLGTLCLNTTATFDVSGTSTVTPAHNGSTINGSGSSNCVTVLHYPTM
ncbi:MAG: hypothetical protein KAU29_06175, partial [Gammaproteobacteria bacterium]|nr:hypothetical protein [Gammaproteobacteria bacterium]